MTKFIVILSGKGGVGKTTSAINLGLAMAKLGQKAIVMDGNLSSPNLSIHLGSTYYPVTIHDVMQDKSHIRNAIYKHPTGLKIIPADVSMEAMKLVDFEKLAQNIQDLHLETDYLIIDGSPGLGRETTKLLEMADEVIVVTNPDEAAILDAKRLIEFTKYFKKTITGVILTKIRKKLHEMKTDEIEKYLEIPIIAKIPHDKKFEKSLHKRTPYLHSYPKKKASQEYRKLAGKITGRLFH